MFTGLVQTLGTLQKQGSDSLRISVTGAQTILHDLELGDSVAVDGVCLTVTEIFGDGFLAAVSPETLQKTTLAHMTGAQPVNLEASLRVGSKIGGHFVTGHIDGTGCLDAAVQTAQSWEMSFTVSQASIARYIVSKGSIAINGISLTVADCSASGDWFKVAVIPLTYAETNLQALQPGSLVNLEGDVLGKYVEKLFRLGRAEAHQSDLQSDFNPDSTQMPLGDRPNGAPITPNFLTEHGYL